MAIDKQLEVEKLKSEVERLKKELKNLTKIETGATPDPRIETLKKIAQGLNVNVDDLIK
ncbi:MAG: helix-turn-helix domain-containing protein [Candidatus Nealsonbacteria bacterium]|nr:helix-turn-helix domain-containing protein [Candidatus Nealsonbacteria bacterium]